MERETDGTAREQALRPRTRRTVRARGLYVWALRFDAAILGLFLTFPGPDRRALVAIWAAVAVWWFWTLRPRIVASTDGLRIIGFLRTRTIPRHQVRGLTVERGSLLWYRTVDLRVLVAGEPAQRVRWVSWNPWLESFLTVAPPSLPTVGQQRVIDRLTSALRE